MHILLGQRQLRQAPAGILLVVAEGETLEEQVGMAQVVALAEAELAEVKSPAEKAQSITRELMDRQTLVAVQVVDTQAAVLASSSFATRFRRFYGALCGD